jgi:hypothetical protein
VVGAEIGGGERKDKMTDFLWGIHQLPETSLVDEEVPEPRRPYYEEFARELVTWKKPAVKPKRFPILAFKTTPTCRPCGSMDVSFKEFLMNCNSCERSKIALLPSRFAPK